jgi:ergothioneine biosynthesis protein EgtB
MFKEKTFEQYQSVREQTLKIVEPLEIEDFVVQTATFMSPPRWHIGHTSWFFEMVLKNYCPDYQIYSEDFLYFFNSYYEKFGERIERAKRGTRSRPTVKETLAYRHKIDAAMIKFIERVDELPRRDEILALIRLGLEHEMQHQELLVYDIKHLLCDLYRAPARGDWPPYDGVKGMAQVPGGLFLLGSAGDEFAFDNEKPSHQVYLQDYSIDRALVSNREYLEFMLAGGYQDYRWWYSDAWQLITREGWQAPLYWEQRDGEWFIRDFYGLHKATERGDEPVCHVSYYEADAYAKWRGLRLPTEAEWEKAACYDGEKKIKRRFPWGDNDPDHSLANLFENQIWGVAPIGLFHKGQSYYGCHQMIGDVWQWTSSDYAPYPGFKCEFDEYTDKWFINQKVLRGGSFATPKDHIRVSYRNYFYPHERWMIAGFRCAKQGWD